MERKQLLQYISETTGIPIQLFADNTVFRFGAGQFEPNPANAILPNALLSGCPVCYTTSPEFVFSGFLQILNTDDYLIIGPMLPSECSRKQALNILKRLQQPEEKLQPLLVWLRSIPPISMERLFGLLRLLDYTMNETSSSNIQQIPYSATVFEMLSDVEPEYINHNDFNFEQTLLTNIEYGKVQEVERQVAVFGNPSGVSLPFTRENLNTYRNIFVGTTTLASRAAIRGGMDYDAATSLCNSFLEKFETMQNTTDVLIAIKQVFLTYAHKVAQIRSLSTQSLLVTRINRQIQSHLYEKITPTTIANLLGMNCSYICTHFKQETGKTISEYINEIKIREGMRLLKVTDLSLIEISTRLGFSSQNYFHTVFKKLTGITPSEYRSRK